MSILPHMKSRWYIYHILRGIVWLESIVLGHYLNMFHQFTKFDQQYKHLKHKKYPKSLVFNSRGILHKFHQFSISKLRYRYRKHKLFLWNRLFGS